MTRRLPHDVTLVVATHNAGKLREIAALFAPYVRAVEAASQYGLEAPEEDGDSFMANASLKARAVATATGHLAIADDSGLSVAALDGEPGVRSARWGGDGRDFREAMQRVHEALGAEDPSATMVTALALAWPDGEVRAFEGRVDGRVVWPPRGTLGFGYEPIFQPEGSTRTYGEMPRDEKHQDDPRARAFAQLVATLIAPRG